MVESAKPKLKPNATCKRLNLVVSLGTAGDTEINDVIDNLCLFQDALSIIKSRDVVIVRPFLPKGPGIAELRVDQEDTLLKVINAVKETIDEFLSYEKITVSLIGHRLNDYFGVLSAEKTIVLQRECYDQFVKNGIFANEITFKYYVCNAYAKLLELKNAMEESFKDLVNPNLQQTIQVKSSPHEVVPNPIFYNLKTHLKPEKNAHRERYAQRAISKELMLQEKELQILKHLEKRVIARKMPAEFKASYLKTTESACHVASLFEEGHRRNIWKKFCILN